MVSHYSQGKQLITVVKAMYLNSCIHQRLLIVFRKRKSCLSWPASSSWPGGLLHTTQQPFPDLTLVILACLSHLTARLQVIEPVHTVLSFFASYLLAKFGSQLGVLASKLVLTLGKLLVYVTPL